MDYSTSFATYMCFYYLSEGDDGLPMSSLSLDSPQDRRRIDDASRRAFDPMAISSILGGSDSNIDLTPEFFNSIAERSAVRMAENGLNLDSWPQGVTYVPHGMQVQSAGGWNTPSKEASSLRSTAEASEDVRLMAASEENYSRAGQSAIASHQPLEGLSLYERPEPAALQGSLLNSGFHPGALPEAYANLPVRSPSHLLRERDVLPLEDCPNIWQHRSPTRDFYTSRESQAFQFATNDQVAAEGRTDLMQLRRFMNPGCNVPNCPHNCGEGDEGGEVERDQSAAAREARTSSDPGPRFDHFEFR